MIAQTLSTTKLIECYLNNMINLRPLNSTHYATEYPQDGDRIVTTDCVTSLQPMQWQPELDDNAVNVFSKLR